MKNKIMPDDVHPKCPFVDCLYGMGLAGRGVCLAGGKWDDPDCSKYENEFEALERWKNEPK